MLLHKFLDVAPLVPISQQLLEVFLMVLGITPDDLIDLVSEEKAHRGVSRHIIERTS